MRFNGLGSFFSTGKVRTEQGCGLLHGQWLEGSSLAYEAPNETSFLPMRCRQPGDSVLLAATVRLGQSSMAAGAPSGGAPAPRTALAAVV
jgi:hypothetical protein